MDSTIVEILDRKTNFNDFDKLSETTNRHLYIR